jgi:hypothetical protein
LTSKEAEKASVEAIDQIIEMGYHRPYHNPILLGLGISEQERNIDACVYMENNVAKRLEIIKLPPVKEGDLKNENQVSRKLPKKEWSHVNTIA